MSVYEGGCGSVKFLLTLTDQFEQYVSRRCDFLSR